MGIIWIYSGADGAIQDHNFAVEKLKDNNNYVDLIKYKTLVISNYLFWKINMYNK